MTQLTTVSKSSSAAADEKNRDVEIAFPTKLSIWKTVLAISLGFACNFIAYNGLSNVESSLNSNQGLGTASMGSTYAALIVSSFILPSACAKYIGYKWTMVCAIPMYTLYILANLYSTFYTLIPTAVLVGLAAAPLWSSKCTYLTLLSRRYSELSGETVEAINSRFFGFFFMIFHSDQIIGNLISSFSLNPTGDQNDTIPLDLCGKNYCDSNMVGNYSLMSSQLRPPMSQVYLMCGIYAGLSLLGMAIIAVFVQPLNVTQSSLDDLNGFDLFKVSLRQAINPYQLLMLPLTVFSGLSQSFMTSDYTKGFITCTLGIHVIGFVMMCAGAFDIVFSFGFGVLLKYIHRSILFTFGAILCSVTYITMLLWYPEPTQVIVFYVFSGLYGMSDAIWQTHFNAFYGIIFTENLPVAYASYRLWESIGMLVGFFWSNPLCLDIKLYVLLPLVIFGLFTYAFVEIKLYRRKRNQQSYTIATG